MFIKHNAKNCTNQRFTSLINRFFGLMTMEGKQTNDSLSKFRINCISCKAPDNAEKIRTIYETDQVKVVLRTDNQCWLGRYIVVPKVHMDPLDFWSNPIWRGIVMDTHVKTAKAVQQAFGAVCVQMAQIGGLTEDEYKQPTTDQRYQHAHIHGIPRYDEHIPDFAGQKWPDPQFKIDPQTKRGRFMALNIDPQAGLPIVKPSDQQVDLIVKEIRKAIEKSNIETLS